MVKATLQDVGGQVLKHVWQYPGVMERLCQLDAARVSNLQISKKLSEEFGDRLREIGLLAPGKSITRNAVISKRARIGSPKREIKAKPKRRGAAQRAAQSTIPADALPDIPDICVIQSERRGLLDLLPTQCRWPIGDPLSPDFHFCNQGKAPGSNYCAHHAARAIQPPPPRQASGRLTKSAQCPDDEQNRSSTNALPFGPNRGAGRPRSRRRIAGDELSIRDDARGGRVGEGNIRRRVGVG